MVLSRKRLNISFPVIIFSFGKVVSATGLTFFGMMHALLFIFKNTGVSNSAIMGLAWAAAACTCGVIIITRVPAIYRQFHVIESNNQPEIIQALSKWQMLFLNLLMLANIASGVFSSVGAYLGTITLSESFINLLNYSFNEASKTIFVQVFAILIAASTFVSYYSFNIRKAKENAIKLVIKPHHHHKLQFLNKKAFKTAGIAFLNIASIPFLSYFLTKHAFMKMPYLNIFLSLGVIQCIALLSSVTALLTNLITTVPATYEYFLEEEKITMKEEVMKSNWLLLKNVTYSFGFVDSSANGLTSFISVIDIAHDAFHLKAAAIVVTIAIGCGISAALLNFAFSIRQGFKDLIKRQTHEPLLIDPLLQS